MKLRTAVLYAIMIVVIVTVYKLIGVEHLIDVIMNPSDSIPDVNIK